MSAIELSDWLTGYRSPTICDRACYPIYSVISCQEMTGQSVLKNTVLMFHSAITTEALVVRCLKNEPAHRFSG